MNRSVTFGVIGGTGSTGRAVARELRRSTDRPILIGGRNLAKLNAVVEEVGAAVSVMRLDVCDPRSVEEFCGRCSVVVNCGGPFGSQQSGNVPSEWTSERFASIRFRLPDTERCPILPAERKQAPCLGAYPCSSTMSCTTCVAAFLSARWRSL